MENRAYAFITGLFVIALSSAAIAAWVWLSSRHVEHHPYVVVSQDAVSGLNAQSSVFFRGVPAGSVEAIRFDRTDLRNILIKIQVDRDLPITHGTYAILRRQGLTGISQIELHDSGKDLEALPTSADKPGQIPMKPSYFDELTVSGPKLFRNLNRLMVELSTLLNDTNKGHIQNILANAEIAAGEMVKLERNTNDTLKGLGQVIASTGDTLITDIRQWAIQRLDYDNTFPVVLLGTHTQAPPDNGFDHNGDE